MAETACRVCDHPGCSGSDDDRLEDLKLASKLFG